MFVCMMSFFDLFCHKLWVIKIEAFLEVRMLERMSENKNNRLICNGVFFVLVCFD